MNPERREQTASPMSRRWQFALLLLPLILYIAALNPFFAPGSYDEILYYTGASSLAEDGTFKFREKFIADWPPATSVLLAIPFVLFGPSVLIAKICILLCAAAGLVLALRLFQNEQRPFPLLTLAVFALIPFSFSTGTRVLSEWPYLLASLLFLHALHRLRDSSKPVQDGLIAGLLLGLASLTKFTGVLLGVAIIAQVIEKWSRGNQPFKIRAIAPETIAAVIGASFFLSWKAKIHWQIATGTAAPYDYYRSGMAPEHFGWFDPLSLPEKIGDLFFRSDAILEALGSHPVLHLAAALPAVLVCIGLITRLNSKERSPSDWYVVALLVMFASFANNKQTRYLMPIAPFLVSYALVGGQRVGYWLRLNHQHWVAWSARGAVAAWMLLAIGLAAQLLFIGNPAGTYGGLNYFVSNTPEKFYRGHWLDLYHACQQVRHDPAPGSIAVIGGEDKYVTYFTQRHWKDFHPSSNFAFLLALDGRDVPIEQLDTLDLQCLKRSGSVILYKRRPTVATDHLSSRELIGTLPTYDKN